MVVLTFTRVTGAQKTHKISAYECSCVQRDAIGRHRGSVSGFTGRKSQRQSPGQYVHPPWPKETARGHVPLVILAAPFSQAAFILSFRSRSTFRTAPSSALFTRHSPFDASVCPRRTPSRTAYIRSRLLSALSSTRRHFNQFSVINIFSRRGGGGEDSKRFSWSLINYQFLRIWSFLAQVSTLLL